MSIDLSPCIVALLVLDLLGACPLPKQRQIKLFSFSPLFAINDSPDLHTIHI
ncbi:hypothetical protein PVAP13_2KG180558 [Panicum virgatum]|uniref:Uncharacterized protein n=1 Tax=Panicum virgatum TaxID=38727 RepID=A0A8T0W212_PANVG|nr:hypothetical protein PVAP13_2KG180558 [Panicum virgatum]